jgi:DNA polymerase III alpha subunit
MVAGLGAAAAADRIVAARQQQLFDHAEDLACRARLDVHEVWVLAAADALMSRSGHRRQQVWDASALLTAPELLREAPVDEDVLELPAAPEGEEVVRAYASLGLTLRSHPLALLRAKLAERRLLTAAELKEFPDGRQARAGGIVTMHQQPNTVQRRGVRDAGRRDRRGRRDRLAVAARAAAPGTAALPAAGRLRRVAAPRGGTAAARPHAAAAGAGDHRELGFQVSQRKFSQRTPA